jgi:hypothetical protein
MYITFLEIAICFLKLEKPEAHYLPPVLKPRLSIAHSGKVTPNAILRSNENGLRSNKRGGEDMKKYSYTTPVLKGAKKPFDIIDENGLCKAQIQRYYPNLLNIVTEVLMTGWEVNIRTEQDDKEYRIKEHFRWLKNEWSIFENSSKIGTLIDIKKLELGQKKELLFQGKKYYYHDKPLQTETVIQDKNNDTIAVVDYRLFDLSRKKEITVFRDEVPLSLLVSMDYISMLKKN